MAFDRTAGGSVDRDAERAGDFVRNAAKLVGVVFLLVGVLGFIPGIVTNYDNLQFAGHDPVGTGDDSKLLGLFHISILHNIVHLLFGVAGLAMAKTARSATSYLVGGGIIYLVLTLYGFIIGENSDANFVPVNTADDVLHLALGLGMIALGMVGARAVKGRTGAGAPR